MNQAELENTLAQLPLGEIRYFDSIPSTNDYAAEWVAQNPANLSLVVADEQTRGRGRPGKSWFTPAGAGLAFSLLIVEDEHIPNSKISMFTGIGALAVCETLEKTFNLVPEIKWPNDVLLDGKKVCGILSEAQWQGNQLLALILGIGINVAPESVPHKSAVKLPATSIEDVLGKKINCCRLLRGVLENILNWRKRINSTDFIDAWEQRLAYREKTMMITLEGQAGFQAQIVGLDSSGRLKLRKNSGEEICLHSGEFEIHPLVDSSSK